MAQVIMGHAVSWCFGTRLSPENLGGAQSPEIFDGNHPYAELEGFVDLRYCFGSEVVREFDYVNLWNRIDLTTLY